jgi:hypothetical protein
MNQSCTLYTTNLITGGFMSQVFLGFLDLAVLKLV